MQLCSWLAMRVLLLVTEHVCVVLQIPKRNLTYYNSGYFQDKERVDMHFSTQAGYVQFKSVCRQGMYDERV